MRHQELEVLETVKVLHAQAARLGIQEANRSPLIDDIENVSRLPRRQGFSQEASVQRVSST
jgi:hypothetical protein